MKALVKEFIDDDMHYDSILTNNIQLESVKDVEVYLFNNISDFFDARVFRMKNHTCILFNDNKLLGIYVFEEDKIRG